MEHITGNYAQLVLECIPVYSNITRNLFVLLMISMPGCGTYIPRLEEFGAGKTEIAFTPDGRFAHEIKKKVYCGLVEATIAARNFGILPRGWAAQLTMSLQVDETGAINPGASFINPLAPGESFTFGLGGTFSSQGTREDKIGSYWYLDRFTDIKYTSCAAEVIRSGNSPLLQNDLNIKEWLIDHLRSEGLLPSSTVPEKTDSIFKQQALTYHIKFIVITSGSATPTWKLVEFTSGNGNLSLVSMNRTRTHDLVITFGPAFKAGTPNNALAQHEATILSNAARSASPGQ